MRGDKRPLFKKEAKEEALHFGMSMANDDDDLNDMVLFLVCFLVQLYFGSWNNSFNLFPNKPWFLRVCKTSLWETLWEKEKLLETSNFSFSHSVLHPFGELSAIFIVFKIVVCKLF